jgi:hypothetical protein
LLDHVRRVAASVPREARTVAWLHEILEFSNVSREELRAAGTTDVELAAIELLTRDPSADGDVYLAHVVEVANTPGEAGELARAVKRADLSDRLEHQVAAPLAGSRPPYRQALRALAGTS